MIVPMSTYVHVDMNSTHGSSPDSEGLVVGHWYCPDICVTNVVSSCYVAGTSPICNVFNSKQ